MHIRDRLGRSTHLCLRRVAYIAFGLCERNDRKTISSMGSFLTYSCGSRQTLNLIEIDNTLSFILLKAKFLQY